MLSDLFQAAELMAREREIRENLRIERNKEIEIVINKLEEQAALQKEESTANLECRMKRLKDKYESQVKKPSFASFFPNSNCTTECRLLHNLL